MAIHSENHPPRHSRGPRRHRRNPVSGATSAGSRAGRRSAAPQLAGCSRGFGAQTDQIYQPGPGISVRSGGVYVINALVMTDGSGHGTLIGALINQQPHADILESVSDHGARQRTR